MMLVTLLSNLVMLQPRQAGRLREGEDTGLKKLWLEMVEAQGMQQVGK